MPRYCFCCDCGHAEELVLPMAECSSRPPCPKCNRRMRRDFSAELPAAFSDPEATAHDVAKQCDDFREGRTVTTRFLAKSIARVPGVRKIIGPDGKQYAFFTSKKDRRDTLKRLGIESD